MTQSNLSEEMLKQAMKEAFSEALQEQRDLLYAVIEDVLEDLALTEAVREGRETDLVDRSEVFQVLAEEK